ncbi:Rne/Rng family ribonuclease [Hyphomicrobium sp. xq]|uniref:Ribonuclease E n=1 Tax=Hyphomicrobium album TaxID=2665159 RepID=A0A6I3KMQ6_9HYPH|nr:ribonuclease E/G [Hyphomicrobium album]MTD93991.1 Rne/Rng family ribonuclease [Hyphomicrobium album]
MSNNNKMLIDATHPEETRVVVLRNGRVEEFDFESAARKLLRGNIYLAKVTRVEPSLQAAFVEYGGNRHGFLAFNEIHPDYYQIPMADRQALLDEEAAAEAEEEAAVDAHAEALARRRASSPSPAEDEETIDDIEPLEGGNPPPEEGDDAEDEGEQPSHRTIAEAVPADDTVHEEPAQKREQNSLAANENTLEAAPDATDGDVARATDGNGAPEVEANAAPVEVERVEQVGAGDALEELPSRPRRRPRSYKIQEVIKRRQVILVQVVKEERGNKGAALTTYLSLAGRYTVLMPNTARGGGISRKITQPQDRKRLKAIAQELEVPEGMGLIIRTAGAARTKQEIKRDFEYLLRLWESVRDLTLQSQAPSLVYEEGNLIKRSIRDLYNKDVDEVIVAGGEAHREAKDFMRMLMPSHAKNVTQYQEPEPLFTRFQIERQLNAMFSPYVTLRSGGYLVINQTEALVAIDVNSGKATREFSIEETAHHTNLEAADEIARQLKLRDLAGLIVIDFIDMEEKRNNRAVERRLKEALRFDRARIQVGRISHFGLLEMSRQRLRTGVLEGSTSQCAHCQGTGIIRSTESVALAVLRGLEDAIMAGARASLIATTTPSVALYILNNKRPFINDMEARLGLPIMVTGSDKLAGANFTIEKGAAPAQPQRRIERNVVNMESGFEGEGDDEGGEFEAREQPQQGRESSVRGDRPERGDRDQPRARGDEEAGSRRRRRRRRGGRGRDREEGGERFADEPRGNVEEIAEFDAESGDGHEHNGHEHNGHDHGEEVQAREPRSDEEGGARERGGRSRRRGRRGGRRGRERGERGAEGQPQNGGGDQPEYHAASEDGGSDDMNAGRHEAIADFPNLPADGNENLPAKEVRRESRAPEAAAPETRREPAPEPVAAPPPAPRRRSGSSEPKLERIVVGEQVAEETASSPTRKGWWQRK